MGSITNLRAASRIERFNRTLRRCARAATAYHSDAGLLAMLRHQVDIFNPHKPHL